MECDDHRSLECSLKILDIKSKATVLTAIKWHKKSSSFYLSGLGIDDTSY